MIKWVNLRISGNYSHIMVSWEKYEKDKIVVPVENMKAFIE